MKLSYAILLLPGLLVACGGDDAPDTTGVFADGAVSGLRYQTKGASGLTNAAGEFKYSDGERVTFSVGGVVIGSATGAARLTPFDLYGVTPPATASALAAELAAPDAVTNLERVLNVNLFLVALDADGNPDNGLDLTGADAALAGASLSFDHEPRAFATQHLVPLLSERGVGNVYAFGASAGAHLFASVGVTIPASAVATTALDLGSNGSVDSGTSSTYNALGQRTLLTASNALGIVTRRTTTTFDDAHLLSTITVDFDAAGGGLFHGRQVTTYARDPSDGHVLTATTDNFQDNVLSARAVVTYTVNAMGSVTTEREESDDDGNGSLDSARITTRELDDHNRRTKSTFVRYSDLGVTATESIVDTYTFDDAGNELEHVYERDAGVDGALEERTINAATYDDAHRVLTQRLDHENTARVLLDRVLTTNTYEDGLAVQTVEQTDVDGNGSFEFVTTITRVFDGRRKVQSEVSDGVNGGIVHILTRIEYTYDAGTGLLTQRKATTNQNSQADAIDDRIELDTYTYDSLGNELTHENKVDSDANLTYDVSEKTTTTYTVITNGVRSLLAAFY